MGRWKKESFRALCQIDVALDPFPYGGATTTCESLIMGVPVITLRGTSMVNNLSASILKYSNCSEWIANDKNEYLRKAQKELKKGIRSKKARKLLRERVKQSDLYNSKRLTKELEENFLRLSARINM